MFPGMDTLAGNLLSSPPAKIVVRCPNWVGDLIMALPVFDCLRAGLPGTCLIAVTREYNAKVIAGHPAIDRVVACNDKSWRGLVETSRAIRAEKAPLGLLLPNSFRSYLPFRLAGVAAIVGYRRGIRSLLVRGPAPPRIKGGFLPMPMLDYYLGLCGWLGLRTPESPKPRLHVTAAQNQTAEALLKKYGIADGDTVVGLNPGAKFGTSKCWPPEYFAELAEILEQRHRCKLLLFVGPGEDGIAARIMAATAAQVIDSGPDRIDLGVLKPMIRRCGVLVTNDTGPRHYATAMDVPVVVLMGPTDPRWTMSNLDRTIVLRKELPCSPCHEKICPDGSLRCMREILPAEAAEAVARLLRRQPD